MLETAREVHRSRGTAPAMLVPWTADSTGWAEMSLMSSRKQMYGIEITTHQAQPVSWVSTRITVFSRLRKRIGTVSPTRKSGDLVYSFISIF